MDSKRFDNWTRNRALRLSRRDALRLVGAGGAAVALPAAVPRARAQGTCNLTIHGETAAGPSAPATFDGTLQFTLNSDGNLTQATFSSPNGVSQNASGHAAGRAIDIQIIVSGNQAVFLSGLADRPISTCPATAAGILSGPQPGDLGAWQTTAETSSTDPSSTASQSNSNDGSAATTSCPAGQVICGGVCVNTQSDPENCGGCGAVCVSGACDGGACAASQTCTADGAPCRVPADCCSVLCPHETQAPGICGCSQIGGVCAGSDDCCQQGDDTQVACLGGANVDRCIVVKGACTADSDCLGQNCLDGQCSSACKPDGHTCQSTSECCNPGCFGGVCGCAQLGQSCSEDPGSEFFCCQGTPVVCLANACCILNQFACSADADCCDYLLGNGSCTNGVCTRTN